MCLAVTIDGGFAFAYSDFAQAIGQHRDGVGIAFAVDGELQLIKTWPGNPDHAKLVDRIREIACTVRPYIRLLHFRFATVGSVAEHNTHPMPVPNLDCALVHNGTMSTWGDIKRDQSDTAFMAEYANEIGELDFLHKVSHSVGVAHANGDVHHYGDWHRHADGVHISNHYTLGSRSYAGRVDWYDRGSEWGSDAVWSEYEKCDDGIYRRKSDVKRDKALATAYGEAKAYANAFERWRKENAKKRKRGWPTGAIDVADDVSADTLLKDDPDLVANDGWRSKSVHQMTDSEFAQYELEQEAALIYQIEREEGAK
jgi:hypothetical protein